VNRKTKTRTIPVGITLFVYAALALFSYNHIISYGLFGFYGFITALFLPVCPSLVDYYFKKHRIGCVRCGAENSYNDDFCNKCGMKLEK
jgi:ribosomal protein L40E